MAIFNTLKRKLNLENLLRQLGNPIQSPVLRLCYVCATSVLRLCYVGAPVLRRGAASELPRGLATRPRGRGRRGRGRRGRGRRGRGRRVEPSQDAHVGNFETLGEGHEVRQGREWEVYEMGSRRERRVAVILLTETFFPLDFAGR